MKWISYKPGAVVAVAGGAAAAAPKLKPPAGAAAVVVAGAAVSPPKLKYVFFCSCIFEKYEYIVKSGKFYETSWNLVNEVSWNFMKLFSISKKAETSQP